MAIALRYAARSHLGLGPKGRNEDSGYAGPHLLVLADGMGGHAAGDVASSMIVGALAPLDEEGYSGEQALRVLGAELHDANAQLREAMVEDPTLAGMGSTTIALLRAGSKLAMAHIGDSRAFLLRDGELSQITKDHSFVQQLVDEHRITAEEAQHHPQRSLVTRVMTGHADDEPDLSIRELRVGDRYLLCSDGLTDFVSAEIVHEIVSGAATPDDAADACIDIALKASTRDNVTVVVADVVDVDDAPPTTPQIVGAAAAIRPKGRRRTRAIPISPAEKAAALSREASGIPADEPVVLADETPTPKILWVRRLVVAAAAAVLLLSGGYAGWHWTQGQYFLGDDAGYVALYRGINQSLGPVTFSSVVERSDVLVTDLPLHYQETIKSTVTIPGGDEATQRINSLRVIALDCRIRNANGDQCGTTTPVTSSTSGNLLPGWATSPATTSPAITSPADPTTLSTAPAQQPAPGLPAPTAPIPTPHTAMPAATS